MEIKCFHLGIVDCADEWPIYSYTVRNIGSICLQYLKFKRNDDVPPQEEDVLKVIRDLANTSKFSDYQNKLTFQLICTKTADKWFDLLKRITKEFNTRPNDVPKDMFSPVVILLCKEEAQHVLSLADLTDKAQLSFIVVCPTEEDKMLNISSKYLQNTLFWTSQVIREIFAKMDKILMERLVFNAVLPMTEYMILYVQNFRQTGKCIILFKFVASTPAYRLGISAI